MFLTDVEIAEMCAPLKPEPGPIVQPPEVIGSEEVAELLRCTPDQVEELARAGEIPGLKIGRPWLFVRADLLAYLAEKARAEAQERRAKRQRAAQQGWAEIAPPSNGRRRQEPPMLPTLPIEPKRTTLLAEMEQAAPSVRREFVPAAEAARLLSMGVSTLWNQVKLGNLPKPIKIGGITRWRVADLEQWAAALDPVRKSTAQN